MKECKNCHAICAGDETICIVCGYEFPKVSANKDCNAKYDQMEYKFQPQKNMLLALFMTVFIAGLGHVYCNLYKRGAISFILSFALNILTMQYAAPAILNYLLQFAGLIWSLYVLYDTYKCVEAINTKQPLPPFLGFEI